MHSHDECERLMAKALREREHVGRLEYLSARCDKHHGDLTPVTTHEDTSTEASDA